MLSTLLPIAYAQPLTDDCNCVIFRLDDVQDNWLADDQIATMELFKEDPLTIGIIANLFGNDSRLVGYIRNNLDRLEIANHGWNHENFAQLPFEEQKELMAKANMKIKDTVGVEPRVFIAPYHEDNQNTARAAEENGIAILSSGQTYLEPANPDAGNATSEPEVIQKLPATASLSEYDAKTDSWKPNSHDQIMADIAGSLDVYGYAVVMMHPRDIELVDTKAVIADVKSMDGVRIASMADAGKQYFPEGAATGFDSAATEKSQSLGPFELGSIIVAVVGASIAAAITVGRRRKRS